MRGWPTPTRALPPGCADVADDLAGEHATWPAGRRFQLLRKAVFRELGLRLGGQARWRAERAPEGTRRMLWFYSWTTVGDAVLDLAPRRLIPASVEVELLIAPHLAPLFATDARFAAVHVEWATVSPATDFVLLDSLRSSSLRALSRHRPRVPFATMREHNAGERFDRAALADRRLRHLFALAPGPVEVPRLDLGADVPPPRADAASTLRIGLALGARLEAKLYPHWRRALEAIVDGWTEPFRAPRFVLLGSGESAQRQRDDLGARLLEARCDDRIDAGSLRDAAIELARCDAFLGVDGGLMHVAIGVGTPGLALFTRAEPRWFLRPAGPVEALVSAGALGRLAAGRVASAFLARLASIARR